MINLVDVMDLNDDVMHTVAAIAMLHTNLRTIPATYLDPKSLSKANSLNHAISVLFDKATEEVAAVEKALQGIIKARKEVSA